MDIVNFNYDEIIKHYINFGHKEKRKYMHVSEN